MAASKPDVQSLAAINAFSVPLGRIVQYLIDQLGATQSRVAKLESHLDTEKKTTQLLTQSLKSATERLALLETDVSGALGADQGDAVETTDEPLPLPLPLAEEPGTTSTGSKLLPTPRSAKFASEREALAKQVAEHQSRLNDLESMLLQSPRPASAHKTEPGGHRLSRRASWAPANEKEKVIPETVASNDPPPVIADSPVVDSGQLQSKLRWERDRDRLISRREGDDVQRQLERHDRFIEDLCSEFDRMGPVLASKWGEHEVESKMSWLQKRVGGLSHTHADVQRRVEQHEHGLSELKESSLTLLDKVKSVEEQMDFASLESQQSQKMASDANEAVAALAAQIPPLEASVHNMDRSKVDKVMLAAVEERLLSLFVEEVEGDMAAGMRHFRCISCGKRKHSVSGPRSEMYVIEGAGKREEVTGTDGRSYLGRDAVPMPYPPPSPSQPQSPPMASPRSPTGRDRPSTAPYRLIATPTGWGVPLGGGSEVAQPRKLAVATVDPSPQRRPRTAPASGRRLRKAVVIA